MGMLQKDDLLEKKMIMSASPPPPPPPAPTLPFSPTRVKLKMDFSFSQYLWQSEQGRVSDLNFFPSLQCEGNSALAWRHTISASPSERDGRVVRTDGWEILNFNFCI